MGTGAAFTGDISLTCVNVPESPPPLGPRATQRIVSPALASGGSILTLEQKFETLSG